VRENGDLSSRIKLIWVVQSSRKKQFAFPNAYSMASFARPASSEGRIAIVTDVERGMRWTRRRRARERLNRRAGQTRERLAARKTSDVVADGEVVWFWHPLLMLSRVEAYSAQPVSDALFNPRGDGDKKELVAGKHLCF